MPPYPPYPPEGWILDEDRALRDLMKGMVVSDHENSSRNVEAWFGHPDLELREQKYPYVTIDLLNIQEGIGRIHRGDLYISDPPDWWGLAPLNGGMIGYILEMPTPVDLDYQISTWSRNPRHDRQILRQLITGGRTMLRGGLLYTADHKIRRMDFQGHVKRDTVENGKRLFNNIFRVRISSEVPWGIIGGGGLGVGPVRSVHAQFKGLDSKYLAAVDSALFVSGVVTAWDEPTRTASVDLGAETAVGVPVSRTVRNLAVGDLVSVSKEPKVSNPSSLADYYLLIIGVE